ncbi:MAG: MiaB/RimO family radical SAM methylthiotransferase [Elusimicrobiota bacterium]
MPKKTFSVISLGCFRNTYDSQVIIERIARQGYRFIPRPPQDIATTYGVEGSYLLIIVTCGFIDDAKREALAIIRQALALKRKKKIKKIAVCGCLTERYPRQLKRTFAEIDEWWGIERFNSSFPGSSRLTPQGVAFLKIAEGCFNHCSYCAIPLIKGSLSSKTLDHVIAEACYHDEKGVKELNLIGQDITSWGKDLQSGENLAVLLRSLNKHVRRIAWIRLLYTHPRHIDDQLLAIIAGSDKICKYIDLPIQHINDRILKAMNRNISKSEIVTLIDKIRRVIPGAVIRTSLIVGFPGETEEEFGELLSFIRQTRFERLGIFAYSREEGTPAYHYQPQVHYRTKQRRLHQLMSLQKEVAVQCNKRFIGQKLDVLVESREGDTFICRSQYDAPEVDGVVFIHKKGLKLGELYRAKIIDTLEYDLVGE